MLPHCLGGRQAPARAQLVQRHPRKRIEELDVAMAPHVVRMMEGRAPPLAALRGDGQDVSKLLALKKVAVALMRHGPNPHTTTTDGGPARCVGGGRAEGQREVTLRLLEAPGGRACAGARRAAGREVTA